MEPICNDQWILWHSTWYAINDVVGSCKVVAADSARIIIQPKFRIFYTELTEGLIFLSWNHLKHVQLLAPNLWQFKTPCGSWSDYWRCTGVWSIHHENCKHCSQARGKVDWYILWCQHAWNSNLFLCGIWFLQIQSPTTAIAYSEDKEALVVGYQNGKIRLWQRTVQALAFYGRHKLISACRGDSYVSWLFSALYWKFSIQVSQLQCLDPNLGCFLLQTITECAGIKSCTSTGRMGSLSGYWVQCCPDGGHEQWHAEENNVCRRYWRDTSTWAFAGLVWLLLKLVRLCSQFHCCHFRTLHHHLTLLLLLVMEVIWPQQEMTTLWWSFGLHLALNPRSLHLLTPACLSQKSQDISKGIIVIDKL